MRVYPRVYDEYEGYEGYIHARVERNKKGQMNIFFSIHVRVKTPLLPSYPALTPCLPSCIRHTLLASTIGVGAHPSYPTQVQYWCGDAREALALFSEECLFSIRRRYAPCPCQYPSL